MYIIPGIEAIINSHSINFSIFGVLVFLRKVEKLSKVLDKRSKQEITVNLSLNSCWKLIKKFLIFLSTHSLILIINPPIIKILFNLLFKINNNRST